MLCPFCDHIWTPEIYAFKYYHVLRMKLPSFIIVLVITLVPLAHRRRQNNDQNNKFRFVDNIYVEINVLYLFNKFGFTAAS